VVGAATDRNASVIDADDVADDAERQARRLQARALLDMELELRRQVLRIAPG
jgi:hypothetical protein